MRVRSDGTVQLMRGNSRSRSNFITSQHPYIATALNLLRGRKDDELLSWDFLSVSSQWEVVCGAFI